MRGRAALALLLSISACTGSGSSGSGVTVSPTIVVDPAQFRGDVPCVAATGGLRSYVATLVDVTPLGPDQQELDAFVLPSSSPVSCDLPVHFHRIAYLHAYVADIQGYDRDPKDLRPIAPGSPIVADEDGNLVAPEWTTSCGRGLPAAADGGPGDAAADGGPGDAAADGGPGDAAADGGPGDAASADGAGNPEPADAAPGPDDSGDADSGAFAFPEATIAYFPLGHTTVLMRNCLPFSNDGGATTQAAVVIEIDPGASGLACGTASGEVGRFEASFGGGPALGAECGQTVAFEGLNPGESYSFEVTAFDGESDVPAWKTECFRVAERGLRLRALCDPLRPAE